MVHLACSTVKKLSQKQSSPNKSPWFQQKLVFSDFVGLISVPLYSNISNRRCKNVTEIVIRIFHVTKHTFPMTFLGFINSQSGTIIPGWILITLFTTEQTWCYTSLGRGSQKDLSGWFHLGVQVVFCTKKSIACLNTKYMCLENSSRIPNLLMDGVVK